VRLVVAFCLVSGPCMIWGWPSHWWLLASAFVAGAAGRGARRPRAAGGLVGRIDAYTATAGLEAPCEGCLDD